MNLTPYLTVIKINLVELKILKNYEESLTNQKWNYLLFSDLFQLYQVKSSILEKISVLWLSIISREVLQRRV